MEERGGGCEGFGVTFDDGEVAAVRFGVYGLNVPE